MYPNKLQHSIKYLDLIILGLMLGSLFFLFLGSRPLSIPDEGNYAEIIREMVETGNYITPFLNGIKFFEKPILLYWLSALAIKIGGVNLWSIRSANALLAMMTCLMTYITGTKLYNRQTGMVAALILSTSILFFSLAHMLTTDMVVSTFMTCTLFSFLLGISEKQTIKRLFYFSSLAIFAALAVLAKGLIGILLPVMIMSLWIFITKEWHYVKDKYIPWYIFLFLLVALPWHLMVMIKNPEFWYLYFIEQHFLRFATNTVGHPQPFWYYIPVLLLGFFPWICFLPQSIKSTVHAFVQKKGKYQIDIFLFIWMASILLFFTMATSKLIAYILPAFPAMALLTARYLTLKISRDALPSKIKLSFFYLLLFSLLLSLFIIFLPYYWKINNLTNAISYSRSSAIILSVGMIISFILAKKNNYFYAFINTVISMAIFLIVLLLAIPAFDGQSIKPLTDVIKSRLTTYDKVIAYNHHFQDLPFYLQRKINIVNSRKLFKYGMRYQPHHEWMMKENDFQQLWSSNARVFAFMHNEDYDKAIQKYPHYHFYILGKTNANILVSNQIL